MHLIKLQEFIEGSVHDMIYTVNETTAKNTLRSYIEVRNKFVSLCTVLNTTDINSLPGRSTNKSTLVSQLNIIIERFEVEVLGKSYGILQCLKNTERTLHIIGPCTNDSTEKHWNIKSSYANATVSQIVQYIMREILQPLYNSVLSDISFKTLVLRHIQLELKNRFISPNSGVYYPNLSDAQLKTYIYTIISSSLLKQKYHCTKAAIRDLQQFIQLL